MLAVHVKGYAGVVQVKGYTQGFIVRDPVVSDQYYELYSYIEARGANMGECWKYVRAEVAEFAQT